MNGPEENPKKTKSRTRKVVLATGMAAVVAGFGGLAAVSFADADQASATGFTDNFEDGNAAGWSKSGGSWSVVSDGSKVLKQAKTGATLAREFAGRTDWTDYSLQAKVKPLTVAAAGYTAIVTRSTSSTSFYRLALTGTNKVRLESVKSGTATVLSEAALTVKAGTSYTLGLSVAGTKLSGSVNGATVVSGTASGSAKGRIGVQTYDATAEFDDVAVTVGATSTPTATK
jgi:pectate lyase